jgi:hypothetical protein
MPGAMVQPSRSPPAWEPVDGGGLPVVAASAMANAHQPSHAADNDLVLQHLNARGFVPFHPVLAQHLGHKAALFLGLCLYWTRHSARHNPHRQGWIHLSAQEIADATTLTRREQDTVRGMLAEAGLLEQQLTGRPPKMHFKLNLRCLANRLEIIDAATATVETAWAWFEKSVSFYRPLGDLAGSAAGGLYLSFALRQQRKALLAGYVADNVLLQPEEIERTLCLSPKVQRTVRERLSRIGVLVPMPSSTIRVRINIQAILACVRGQGIASLPTAATATAQAFAASPVPAARPRSGQVAACAPGRGQESVHLIRQPDLLMSAGIPPVAGTRFGLSMQMLRVVTLGSGAAPRQVAEIPQLRSGVGLASAAGAASRSPVAAGAQSDKLDSAASAQTAKLETSSTAQSAKLDAAASAQTAKLGVPKAPNYRQTCLSNTTTTNQRARLAEAEDPGTCRRREVEIANTQPDGAAVAQTDTAVDALAGLIFPKALDDTVLAGIRAALLQAPVDQRQPLLDELQGQLLIPTKTIHNPVGWMLGVMRNLRQGATLALAHQVARDRAHHTAFQRQVATAVPPANPIPVSDPQAREDARQRLNALRADFARRGARS